VRAVFYDEGVVVLEGVTPCFSCGLSVRVLQQRRKKKAS
jgi:hypothetical protein